MERIIDKISVGSTVFSDGRLYTITGQVDTFTWEWEHADGGTGQFQFTEDQMEDAAFVIIN
jgi:hypothetical protein